MKRRQLVKTALGTLAVIPFANYAQSNTVKNSTRPKKENEFFYEIIHCNLGVGSGYELSQVEPIYQVDSGEKSN